MWYFILPQLLEDPACKVNKKLNFKNKSRSFQKMYFKLQKKWSKKFIFFSTCSNYGLSKNSKLLKETDKLKPLSLYAKTKVKFEKYFIER